uniref:beta-ketoacyl synthase N-terminal-like domain-containing protein n=1 Tax=Desulfococcus sp. TaxID=2025834 RepID=UPI0035932DDA
MRIFVVGMGVVSPLGIGVPSFRAALKAGAGALGPLTLFAEAAPLPVGQVRHAIAAGNLPRTHAMALMAAREALADAAGPVDAVVLGGTTGGMLTTETQLEAGECRPEGFRYHGTGTTAEILARECRCPGPAITVSTACSSGAAAIKIALEFLRAGRGRRVLAGGADSLCRLTCHGFHALQLVDPEGARPFDRDRRGMSVGEGAAVLLLAASESPPPNALAEVLGGGLSCDAFHPTAPHPEGAGAVRAIRAALSDAGVVSAEIGYIHLHGTGTPDNDRSEARALNAVFGLSGPPASSLKGAMGHPLAAAGAMGAAAAVLCVSEGLIPANTGCRVQDPEIRLALADAPLRRTVQTALSNSFGFGGNNAALVFGAAHSAAGRAGKRRGL